MTKIQSNQQARQTTSKHLAGGPKDASATVALNKLGRENTAAGSISGKEMADAILQATKDPDNQAAGKEYNAIKKWVGANQAKLSPEAKKVFEVYSKQCEKSRASGQTGIDFRAYNKMTRDMQTAAKPQYKDASTAAALKELTAGNGKKGSISGKEMAEAILNGTRDLDGQSAAKEHADISKFVKENGHLLSPEAKQAFAIYDKAARAAKANGNQGIPQDAYNRMARDMMRAGAPNYADKSTAAALNALAAGNKEKGSISGQEMMDAIVKGTADLDGNAATKEHRDIAKFARENEHLLSPEAKAVYAQYEKTMKTAGADGKVTIKEFMKMQVEMKKVAGPQYSDKSAAAQLNALAAGNTKPGSISGKEMQEAILKGTADLDNQAAGREFADIAKFVKENGHLLSPEAKDAFKVYESFARAAQARGQTGLAPFDSIRMRMQMDRVSGPRYGDMSAAQALNGLARDNKVPGSISGQEMMQAITNGTRDLDAQAAGKEYADIAKFVRENEQLLSPQAKQAFAVYEKYAKAAQAKGQTGIDLPSYGRMQLEMANVTRPPILNLGAFSQLQALGQSNPSAGAIGGGNVAGAVQNMFGDLQNVFGQFGNLGANNPATGGALNDIIGFNAFGIGMQNMLTQVANQVFDLLGKAIDNVPNMGTPGGPQTLEDLFKQIGAEVERLLGEVGRPPQPGPNMTTMAVGEEGGQAPKPPGALDPQMASRVEKEEAGQMPPAGGATTRMVGEEGGQAPQPGPHMTTMMVGEEGGGLPPIRPPFFPRPDASAASAVNELLRNNPKPGSISGKEMTEAIIKGTADLDNEAARKEFAEFSRFVKQHGDKLSPEARKAFEVYERHARGAQARGESGIPLGEYMRMQLEMRGVSAPVYKDAGAGAQLNALAAQNKTPGSVSGKEMMDAIIKGTADLDGQAAGKEYGDIAKFVRENEQLLSPEAKAAFAVYDKHAKAAQARGQTGIDLRDFHRMTNEMAATLRPPFRDATTAQALTALKNGNPQPGSISGREMTDAIINGTRDLDGQAAGREFADISKFVKENGNLLSPEAKRAFATYERYAKNAQAKGQTGIPMGDYMRMQAEMRMVSAPGYKDRGAAMAINQLAANNTTPGSISGKEMADAINRGIADLDNQAAGREFADFAKFARENQHLLSPDAKKAFAVYEKHARAAQARGQTGIPVAEIRRMQQEMLQAYRPSR